MDKYERAILAEIARLVESLKDAPRFFPKDGVYKEGWDDPRKMDPEELEEHWFSKIHKSGCQHVWREYTGTAGTTLICRKCGVSGTDPVL